MATTAQESALKQEADKVRNIILHHTPGSLCEDSTKSDIHSPIMRLVLWLPYLLCSILFKCFPYLFDLPKTNIGIFGYTGSGKSSFINVTFKTVLEEPILHYRAKVGAGTDYAIGTLTYEPFSLSQIMLWDTRGIEANSLEEQEEVLRYFSGEGTAEVKRQYDRETEQKLLARQHLRTRGNNTLIPLDGMIVLIPAHLPSDSGMRDFLKIFSNAGIPFVIGASKLDQCPEEDKRAIREKISKSVGIHIDQIYPVCSYPDSSHVLNAEEELDVLNLILASLWTADQKIGCYRPWWITIYRRLQRTWISMENLFNNWKLLVYVMAVVILALMGYIFFYLHRMM